MLLLSRYVLVTIYFLFISTLCLILAILQPFNIKNAHRFLSWFSEPALKILGLEFICDWDPLTKNYLPRPAIFIGNHQRTLDISIFGMILPPKTLAIGKRAIIFVPIFGQLFWLAGQILLDRKNTSKAYSTLDSVVTKIKNEQINIIIFPEGTRSNGKGLGTFKKGAFYLGIECSLPIIPIVTNSYLENINFNKWKSGTIRVKVMAPIITKGLGQEDIDKLTLDIRALYEKTQKELDQKS